MKTGSPVAPQADFLTQSGATETSAGRLFTGRTDVLQSRQMSHSRFKAQIPPGQSVGW